MPVHVTVEPAVRGRLDARALGRLRRRTARMAAAAALADPALGSPDEVEIGLTLTDDQMIRRLNRDYRRKDRPTDVLAFAMREGEGGTLHAGLLGDVLISLDTAARQARERRHSLEAEVLFLWAHGLCHLLGYDHPTAAAERRMNARAEALLAEAGRRGPVRPG